MIRRVLAVVALAVVALVVVLVVKTLTFASRQVAVAPLTDLAVDGARVAPTLSAAIQLQTISHQDRAEMDGAAFDSLRALLERSFPKVHATLTREIVGDHALLYTWKGSDPSLPATLILAHQDVVPIEAGTETAWTHAPFSGDLADGYIWGRGAIDDKASLVGSLEAVELLLSNGFQPKRTVLLAFGHDEEIGGDEGAVRIANLLESRRIPISFGIDEGLFYTTGVVPGLASRVAMIGIAEKGYLSVEVVAKSAGGHSSSPPPHTAAGLVAEAVTKLEANQLPAKYDVVVGPLGEFIGPEMPFGPKLAFANAWLFSPLLAKQFGAKPSSNSLLRTTTAVTMLEGGVKENVLPVQAKAVINFRILPGESIDSVLAHVREVVGPGLEVRQHGAIHSEPSPRSSTTSKSFQTIAETIRAVLPGTTVAPSIFVAATDSRHYAKIVPDLYRFCPLDLQQEDIARFHGTNERLSVENYASMIRFYAQLIRKMDEK